eukprot:GFUD01132617.1.p1 GENE.GFUD01132617.1~~GFUD01132617.1.p1  ORF type:complete len:255 (+),score=60.89 GFUD01132617.1:122-886(+)
MATAVPCQTKSLEAENETLHKFLEDSTLKQYLFHKTRISKVGYTFSEILRTLVNIIKDEKLFDVRNPSIVICSTELEQALDMRAFHVTELRDLIVLHLESADGSGFSLVSRNVPCGVKSSNRFYGNPSFQFKLQPSFLKVIRSIEGSDPHQTIFRYAEIVCNFTSYILSKRNEIFDPRNLKIAFVESDPLGEAFKVSAFHRCQARHLLDQQLLCLSLTHPAAMNIVRCLPSKEIIQRLDIPGELRDLLGMMTAH